MSFLSKIALGGCVLAAMTATAARQVVTLGVNEGAQAGQMAHEMAGVVAQLQTSPSIDVRLKTYPNHDALYAALKASQVDVAFLGAVKYVEAHYDFGATPIVAECCSVRTFIAVMPGSPYQTVEQLRGKRFGFGYEDSTTTHLIPALMLSSHGIKQKDVDARFLGHQPVRTVEALMAGKVDAIAVSDYVYGQYEGKIRVIERSSEFPGPPVTARRGLSPAVVAELRRLMVAYKPKDKTAAQHFAKGAMAVTDNDYNRIRFLCKVLFDKMYQ